MQEFKHVWKKLAAEKKITARNVVEYAILRAMAAKSNAPRAHIAGCLVKKAFKPVTNKNKLANGGSPWMVLRYIWGWYHKDTHLTILGEDYRLFFDNEEEFESFKSIAKQMTEEFMGRKYMYFFVAQEGISREQQLVQCAHVALAAGRKLDPSINPHGVYFTVVGVPKCDFAFERRLAEMGHRDFTVFREPDMGNKSTAIALQPIDWDKRGDLLSFELLSLNDSMPHCP